MIHRIRLYGIVQGVGFRPTVARHAAAYGILGSVSNKGPFVEVYAKAPADRLLAFEEAIVKKAPRRAIILKTDIDEIDEDSAFTDFQIVESEKTKGDILISPDLAVCEDCKRELYEKGNERYLHPFINCTLCGPRLTILDALPYDRVRTSMKAFPMCPSCRKEYEDPADRRYDAQPVCCNDCGPVVYLLKIHDREDGTRRYENLEGMSPEDIERVRAEQPGAITRIRETIARGGIAAIKGIGGYHLCCDATSQAAVSLLRERKRRPAKPFAVMMKDIETVRENCFLSKTQEELLTGHQKPIILLKKRKDSILCEAVAPGNPKAGVMLPYAPVQLLLFDYDDPVKMPKALVMTSANTSGAPICRDEKDALAELSHLCDEILAHNRMIRIRADDTVMDFYEDQPYMIRRSRGYAPLPLMAEGKSHEEKEGKAILAIGGELKNTFCIRNHNLCYLSPYVGDMEDIRTVEALKETIKRFQNLLEVEIGEVVCDLHPKYNTTLIAEEMGLPLRKVQHHYAHILSCMAENRASDPVIGVCFDGTGYGSDGTIWGGEILLADPYSFVRAASIHPFMQVGGDMSAREGWRIAVSMLYGLAKRETEDKKKAGELVLSRVRSLALCSDMEARAIMGMSDLSVNAVLSSSAGRLFDSVSAVLGIVGSSTFEGEAATALQFKAEEYAEDLPCKDCRGESKNFALSFHEEDGRILLPTDALFADIVKRRLAGEDIGRLAYEFHAGLAHMTVLTCRRIASEQDKHTIALSGGCFQNTLLLKLTEDELLNAGFRVLRHHLVPPNDGGIALGQAVYSCPGGNNE